MKKFFCLLIVLHFSTSSCGSSSEGNFVSITGQVAGSSYQSESGAFDDVGGSQLLIAVADQGDICGMATSGQVPSDFQWLSIVICVEAGSEAIEYTILPGNPYIPCDAGSAWVEHRSITGGSPSSTLAESGTVSISSYSDQALAGTVDVLFSGQDAITGEFNVEFCAALNN